MVRTAAITIFLLSVATNAAAQSAGASATLEMRQSLTVSTARTATPTGQAAASQVRLEDGSYQITGDPDRAYRVRTVTADGEAQTVIYSVNTGKISEGGVGILDALGRDTIRIAPARSAEGAAQPVSLTIEYE